MRRNTLWIAILCVSSVVLSSCCLIGCVRVVQRARADLEPQAAQIRSAHSRLASLNESQEGLQLELERLANRVKMQRVRNATEHGNGRKPVGDDLPDPYTNPDEWRAAANKRLTQGKLIAR